MWAQVHHLSALRQMMYVDARAWLPDDLLVKADKMTMAHALELRVPLLDHELCAWAFGLPDAYVIGKRILVAAAGGWIPPEILTRRKTGFANPIGRWLRGPLYDLARDIVLAPSALAPLGRTRTATLVHQHRRGGGCEAELYALLVLELWRREVLGARAFPAARGAHKEIAA
jgi:asparagine synthase (glutamine-hydrolysing)